MTLIRLIDYPLMGEGARNIYDPANDMPADYIVKAVGGNVHRNAVIVSDSPRILGVLAASGRRDIPLRYAWWTEDAWWDQRALPAYLDRVRVCRSWDMAVQSDTRQVVVIRSLPAGPAGEARPGNGEVKLGGFMRGLSGRKSLREHRVFVRPYDQDVGRVGLRRASVDVVVAPSCRLCPVPGAVLTWSWARLGFADGRA